MSEEMPSSLMDQILNHVEAEDERVTSEVPSDYVEPIKKIGDYVRKYSFESVIYSLNKKERAEIENKITDDQRKTFQKVTEDIETQKAYFQLFDKEFEILLLKKEDVEKKADMIIQSLEEKLKIFDKSIDYLMNGLNDWLNLKGYLAKEMTVQDWGNFCDQIRQKYLTEEKEKAIQEIRRTRSKIEERMMITHYLFFEVYDTFIREKPLE